MATLRDSVVHVGLVGDALESEMLVDDQFSELGVSADNDLVTIQAALVSAFGDRALLVAQQQCANGVHEPSMAILWTRIVDRLRQAKARHL